MIDSTGILELVAHLEETYGIEVSDVGSEYTDDGSHLNPLGRDAVATQLLRVLANLQSPARNLWRTYDYRHSARHSPAET